MSELKLGATAGMITSAVFSSSYLFTIDGVLGPNQPTPNIFSQGKSIISQLKEKKEYRNDETNDHTSYFERMIAGCCVFSINSSPQVFRSLSLSLRYESGFNWNILVVCFGISTSG